MPHHLEQAGLGDVIDQKPADLETGDVSPLRDGDAHLAHELDAADLATTPTTAGEPAQVQRSTLPNLISRVSRSMAQPTPWQKVG